jgi:hypothetical protein
LHVWRLHLDILSNSCIMVYIWDRRILWKAKGGSSVKRKLEITSTTDLTHTWLWTVIVSHLHVIVRYVRIELVLRKSLHSNVLANWGVYIHQSVFELAMEGSGLDLNDDAKPALAMSNVSGCD